MKEEVKTEPTPKEKKAKADKQKLFDLYVDVANKSNDKVADYAQLVKHTGGYLSQSMVIAYKKGIHDALQTLLKEITKDETKTT